MRLGTRAVDMMRVLGLTYLSHTSVRGVVDECVAEAECVAAAECVAGWCDHPPKCQTDMPSLVHVRTIVLACLRNPKGLGSHPCTFIFPVKG